MNRKSELDRRINKLKQELYDLLENGDPSRVLQFISSLTLNEGERNHFFGRLRADAATRLLEMYRESNQPLPEALCQRVARTTPTPNRGTAPPNQMNEPEDGTEDAPQKEKPPLKIKSRGQGGALEAPLPFPKKPWWKEWLIWVWIIGVLGLVASFTWIFLQRPGEEATAPPTKTAGEATAAATLLTDETVSKAIAALAEAQAEARRAVAAAEARAGAAEARVIELQKRLTSYEEIQIPDEFALPEGFTRMFVAP